MARGQDLSHIYQLRSNFSIIALTGRTCSGASTVGSLLENGFGDGSDFPDPFSYGYDSGKKTFIHNEYRKYRIVYEYSKVNFKQYIPIKYRDILALFIIEHGLQAFILFLQSSDIKKEFELFQSKLKLPTFENEITGLKGLEDRWEKLNKKLKELNIQSLLENGNRLKFFEFYFGTEFQTFCKDLNLILKQESVLKRNKVLQIIANNLRRSGKPYDFITLSSDNIFTVVDVINILVKCCRRNELDQIQVVIDSLRNPLEIMFFKQRFAAFYTMAVNREDDERGYWTRHKFTNDDFEDVKNFISDEYSGAEDKEFYKPNVEACLQQADIHIAFLSEEQATEKNSKLLNGVTNNLVNKEVKDNASPYHSWEVQVLKYVSLICHPGLIPPSPEERCMQLAYTAKHNSGCISRHVGAAITDEFYSIKAIGWNNTPEGLVPCSLRNAKDLVSHTHDFSAFTTYEVKKIEEVVKENFEKQVEENKDLLKGRNVCFCFKSLQNSIADGKNQVHTRSLHAEESAFLQLSKYGGTGILGGKLFTTASPCELCAKKAYQLGIRVIYYIDPYPGISLEHILSAGSNPIEMRLFNGAIGNAYHWLYDPIMPYKNEITLLLNNEVKDLTKQYKDKIKELQDEINQLRVGKS